MIQSQSMNKIKYFLYARKSTEDKKQQVASIPAQLNEMKKIAANEGLELIDILCEEKSAKKPGRPVFNRMIERINKGEASGIICWKLDRLSRNPIDGGSISWLLQTGTIEHIRVFDKSYYPTDNVLLMSVELGMANQFIRELSAVVKRGLNTKAQSGWFPHQPPIGYKNDPLRKKGFKEILIDEERFPLVRKMFDLMLTGSYTPPKIWEMTKEWGLKTIRGYSLSRSGVYKLFTIPFYYGEFEFPQGSGNWMKGNHRPMITIAEYDRIQVLLGRKGNPRAKTYSFPYTGMLKCGECGASITAEIKNQVICPVCKLKFSHKRTCVCPKCNTAIEEMKNPTLLRYVYYHCTKRKDPHCTQGSVEEKVLEKQITSVLDSITIPEDFQRWVMNELRSENMKVTETRNKVLASQRKSYDECNTKLSRLLDMRLNSELSEQEYADMKTKYSAEKSRLFELISDTDRNADKWLDTAEQVFIFAREAKKRFDTGTLADKKMILQALGQNLTIKDKTLTVEIEKPLVYMEKISREVKSIFGKLEPENLLQIPIHSTINYDDNLKILRR